MPAKAVLKGRLGAALCTPLMFAAVYASAAVPDQAAVGPTTPAAAVTLELHPQNAALSSLQRLFPLPGARASSIAVSYYHPLIQICSYSDTFSGAHGSMVLPGERRLRARFLFAVHIAGEERVLIPGVKGAQLRLLLPPARVLEEWTWPDGLSLTRTYYQSPPFQGTAIRFVVRNQSPAVLNGLRFTANVYDPEIMVMTGDLRAQEEDDELFADPRSAVLFQRDYILREESWLGWGWSTEGGLIAAGEGVRRNESWARAINIELAGLCAAVETPARDLPPGQVYRSTFWTTWANDRETIAKMFTRLRKSSDYRRWESDCRQHARRGLMFSCQDPYLCYLFQSLKTWAPWMVRKDSAGRIGIASLLDNQALLPAEAYQAADGLVAFRQLKVIRQYLDFWLDQRSETPSVAYALILAWRYYLLTRDDRWLSENCMRLKDLADYLREMDHDQDGLPDYRFTAARGSQEILSDLAPSEVKYLKDAIASLQALRGIAEILKSIPKPEFQASAQECQTMMQNGQNSLTDLFWYAKKKEAGYYAAAYAAQTGRVPCKTSQVIGIIRMDLGESEQRQQAFTDLW
ncbi:hypothetical protein JW933_09650, partial [candidate division FCPU426 bacterium]|nr:hypothetical protein [candidate division FCPU426 bacterium]